MFTQSQRVARTLFALTFAASGAAALAQADQANPAATHVFARSKPIEGRYIVVFKDSVVEPDAEAAKVVRGHKGRMHHTYTHAVKGFTASLPDAALKALRNDPRVDYIEQDQTFTVNQVVSPANQATWGLDRLDQADRPLDSLYYFKSTGSGVNAFIIDTGIRSDHVEFTGRLKPGFNAIADTNGTNDCNGHGTHVAGIVGGTTWGVAKGVSLIPVRVLNCAGSGTSSGVIAGIDWVARSTARPAVANMSLAGGPSASVNAAVAGAVSKGVTMVVAAGNSNADACASSPASEPSAITVGATTSGDAKASYSNYGKCVDIFAPGSSIKSAWNTSATATTTISGTSMATPHVTGVAALALADSPTASPAAVATLLTSNATVNRLTGLGVGSPNLLVFSMAAGAPVEPAKVTVATKTLNGSATWTGSDWTAKVTATIRNISTGALVANATVSGSFSPGGTARCVTGSTGSCTMSSGVISKSIIYTLMTVTNVSGTNLIYDSSQNSATQIAVAKP